MIEFGDCTLDISGHVLTLSGIARTIEPRVFDLVTLLVTNPLRVFSREELLQAIWPHSHVCDSAVSRAVMKARRAIGDDPHRPTYILNVPRVGYRFCGISLNVDAVGGYSPAHSTGAALRPRDVESYRDSELGQLRLDVAKLQAELRSLKGHVFGRQA